MRITKAFFEKNPFIGLFLRASDRILLVPRNAPRRLADAAAETLAPGEVIRLFVNQSHLIGVYAVMNSNGCVLPESAEKEEVGLVKKAGLNVSFLSDRFSAVGNNVLANDRAAVVNPEMSRRECRLVGDCLGVEVFQFRVGGFSTVGSINVATNNGLLAYTGASEKELKRMEECLGVRGVRGSANMGVPFNALGVVANSRGAVVGGLTTGFETNLIHEAFS